MIGIASGILRGQEDTLDAGLPKYGNVYNFAFHREVKHVRELLLKDLDNV